MNPLADRAARHGVAARYQSFWGEEQAVTDAVLRAALAAMGQDPDNEPAGHEGFPAVHVAQEGEAVEVRWAGGREAGQAWRITAEEVGAPDGALEGWVEADGGHCLVRLGPLQAGYWRLAVGAAWCRLAIAPRRCWSAPALQQGERWWGCTIQLYALRSSRNWGVGDFGDLRRLVDVAAQQGATFIGLSPLHALFPHNPAAASPYSPSSRTALNPLYLDVQALAEIGGCDEALQLVQSERFQDRLRALRAGELVDYPGVAAAKDQVLRLLWRDFDRQERDSRRAHFEAYVHEREATLGRHALFEALQAHLCAADPGVWGWPAWPEPYRDPAGDAVREFARMHAGEVRYRFWLQWLGELQLEAVQRYARSRGMGLGLYCDLAVGVNGGGADTWVQPGLFALGMHAGAPPDALNALGQDWGLPPWNPRQLKAARYQPFIDTLRANMRHCGALRLDHVMALMRLFWTGPQGGTYVSYPLADLLGLLALESHRHECMVIGEDLGTVAPRMREAMHERCLLSYRPLLFERGEDGSFRPPAQWQAQALAVVSTHDLPTLRGFWLGEDIELQARLDLYPDAGTREQQVLQRAQDRVHLLLALQREGLLPEGVTLQPTSLPDATAAFVEAVYAYLARTPCWLVGVQLEDLTGQVLHVNVPGTTEDRFPNWRRKLAIGVDELAGEPRWARVAAVLRAERSGPAPQEAAQADLPPPASAQVPGATYRVQFHKGCTFEQVTRAVPYLHALGVSHLYSSPYLRARPGSSHGYDIVDHGEVNPEVGDAAQHERLCAALRRHGMGQLLDIVPNHMGVLEADNAWWLDVLEHGRASRHAQTFDIEWSPAAPEMAGRVLLPVLGDHYGRVLEAGEIRLEFDPVNGEFGLRYWGHRFPIDPAHYPDIFAALPAPPVRNDSEGDSHAVVHALLDAFGRLPARDAEESERRGRDSGVYKRSLARLVGRHEWLAHWIEACLQRLNGQPGDAASFDELDRLISAQAYRLADWRVASDDVNYRRFFDVNTLAALRMERQEVFEATHRKVLQWLQDGWLAGLRIDHPDGLSDPQAYFEELQRRHARQAQVGDVTPRAVYLVVEKIQAEHEQLPEAWPVHGDTGYRFGSLVNGLWVRAENEPELSRAYAAFTGASLDFDEVVYQCKKLIIETSLFSELNWLMQALHRITRGNRRRRDFTRNRLRVALAEVAACFPVYRTYLRPGEPPGATDRQHTDWALAAARRRLGGAEAKVLDHLREVLLGEGEAAGLPAEQRDRFVARWQQFTAPVTAKAVEDTAFYRFVRLVSLNEVGSDPRSFGVSVAAFHAANGVRQRYRPGCLLGTSTHDSKRAEDLRARIDVISEDPLLWQDVLQRISGWAELYLTHGDKGAMPCRNDIWLLFQTVVGIWPAQPPDEAQREALRSRVQAYMLKAAREAKVHTNWHCPDEPYEEALARYVDGVLRPGSPNPFADEMQRVAARVAPFGFRNSLAQLALKLTVPGIPDIYQGCESWSFSLVDPDNRAPVDFDRLAAQLLELQALYAGGWPTPEDWSGLHRQAADGRIKHLVTARLLQLRREREALFRGGAYHPVGVEGPAADHAVAFARVHEGDVVLVVAARLTYTLCQGDDARWQPAAWEGTRLQWNADSPLRRTAAWRNWMTGTACCGGDGGPLPLDALFGGAGGLPFAVLVPLGGTP